MSALIEGFNGPGVGVLLRNSAILQDESFIVIQSLTGHASMDTIPTARL
jgi:hypothetical protein